MKGGVALCLWGCLEMCTSETNSMHLVLRIDVGDCDMVVYIFCFSVVFVSTMGKWRRLNGDWMLVCIFLLEIYHINRY